MHERVADLDGSVDILARGPVGSISPVGNLDWTLEAMYGWVTLSMIGFELSLLVR